LGGTAAFGRTLTTFGFALGWWSSESDAKKSMSSESSSAFAAAAGVALAGSAPCNHKNHFF
jgi:hypothetical protein